MDRSSGRRAWRGESTWTIGELARRSGVASRTLRHHDAIGLLAPRGVGAGGRRVYGRHELLRLQQVLVLRELDVSLRTVTEILAGDGADDDDARMLRRLREHLEGLLAERDRFDRLARTVASTITALDKGADMAADKLDEGFDQGRHEAEARERWGDEPVDRGNADRDRMGPAGRPAGPSTRGRARRSTRGSRRQ